jgi:hypothetical protein
MDIKFTLALGCQGLAVVAERDDAISTEAGDTLGS